MKKLIKLLSNLPWDNVFILLGVLIAVAYAVLGILNGKPVSEIIWPLVSAAWAGSYYINKLVLKGEIETNQHVIITQEYIIDALRKDKAALQELHKKYQS